VKKVRAGGGAQRKKKEKRLRLCRAEDKEIQGEVSA